MVVFETDSVFERGPEGGVARTVDEFMFVEEEVLRAYDAAVVTYLRCFPVFTCECTLCSFVLSDPVLEWS